MIKILYIEDDSAHIELTSRALENSGNEFDLQTASTITNAFSLLKDNYYDVILSDYRLPDGSGLDVIRIAQEQMLSTAIVLITNLEDINTAVAALKAGAVDYIVKQSDYLLKLPIVLSNAHKHTQIERQKKALSEIENKYRNIFENAVEGIFQSSPDGHFLSVNPAMAKIFGYKSPEDMIENINNIGVQIHLLADSLEQFTENITKNGVVENFEALNLKKDGKIIWTSTNARLVKDGNGHTLYYEGSITDITKQKNADKLLERQLKALTVLHTTSVAGTQSNTEDEIIAQVTQITASIYSDVCGVLLLNDQGYILTPHRSYMGANVTNWENGYPITEGITGRAVRTGGSIRISDINNDPNYIQIASETKSEMCVPIRVHERIIGVFNVESKQLDAFDEEDERLLNTIAGGLGTAIEKLRLFEAEQAQHQRETAILNLIRTAASSLDINLVLQSILDQLIKVIPSDAGTIQLLDGNQLNTLAAIGPEAVNFAKGGPIKLSEYPLNYYVVTESQTVRVDNTLLDNRYQFINDASNNILSFLGIPLIVKGKTIGMITLDSYQSSHFTEQDEELGLALANHASIAIDNARLFDVEQKRRKQAEILREATGTLTSFFEPNKLFENIFVSLAKLVNYDSVSIELVNNEYVEIVAGQNIPGELIGKKYLFNPKKWDDSGNLRKPVIISDIQAEERFEKFEQTNYIRCWMGIPLLSKDKTIGFLNFDSRTPDFFNQEHAAIAQTFANQVAIAIENARLFQEESRRSQIIEAMANIANEIAITREVIPALDKIADRTLTLLNASSVAIYLLQDDQQTIKIISARGVYQKELISHTIKLSEGITGNVIANGKPEIVDDVSKDMRRVRVPGTAEIDASFDTMMSAPLILLGKVIGAISVWRLQSIGFFDKSELNFLVSIAHQASISIESLRLFEETTRRAQEAAAIAEVGRGISSTLQLDKVFERIAIYAKDLLKAETSAVYLTEPGSSLLRAISAIGVDSDEIKNDPLQPGIGILGDIALRNSGEIVNNTTIDSRAIPVKGTKILPHEHVMGVPVLSNNQLTGLLVVWRTGKDTEFKATDLDFLSSLAQQAAVAIENARLYTVTLQRLDELEMVSRVSYALRAAHDTKEMIPILLNEIKANIDTDTAAIWLYDPGKNELIPIASGGSLKDIPKSTFKPNEGIVGTVYASGTMHISPSLSRDPVTSSENIDLLDETWSGITLPIRTVSETIGVLSVSIQAPHKIEQSHIRLMTTLTEIAGNAIYRSNLFERSEEQIRRLMTLREMDIAISSSLDLHITLGILTEHLLTKMGVSAATVLVFNPDSQTLNHYASIGFKNRENVRTPQNVGDGLAGQILLNRRAIFINDLNKEPIMLQSKLLKSEQFISFYAVPLFSKGATRGVLETYFRHPFTPSPDWLDFLQTLAEQAIIAIDSAQLFENLQRSNQELSLAYDTTLEGWGKALELRDKETQGHTYRVTNLTLELARQMNIPESDLLHIRRGALLHDIGKMGVPDNILHKSGTLTNEEVLEMRKHPQYAYDLLYPIKYLRSALDIAYCHHEWWDGSGYPRGLKGEEIPLAARIFAIIDVWDALLSDRPYRLAWSHKKVLKYIKDLSNKQFDPQVASVFFKMIESDNAYMKSNTPKKARKVAPKKPAKRTESKTKKMR